LDTGTFANRAFSQDWAIAPLSVVSSNRPADENPTLAVKRQKRISLAKIEALKDNFQMLELCKEREWVLAEARKAGILKQAS